MSSFAIINNKMARSFRSNLHLEFLFSLFFIMFVLINPISAETILTPASGPPYGEFGDAVDIDGDYAIVGDPWYGTVADPGQGRAYIYHFDGTSWSLHAELIPSDIADEDHFGSSVAISGDYAVVGSPNDDDNGSSSGSVYFYRRAESVWIPQKYTPLDGSTGDLFGCSVSISGDYALVGASSDDDNGTDAGSAYIMLRGVTTWGLQLKVTQPDGYSNGFGESVALSGNYAIVGAKHDSHGGTTTGAGAAYIYFHGFTWSFQSKVTAPDAGSIDYFGNSVDISSDYAIVGAYFDDDNGDDSGSAYIFRLNLGTWVFSHKLLPDVGEEDDEFGQSVSIYKGNDYAYAVVGSRDNDYGTNSGAAYCYEQEGTSWTQCRKLTASDAAAGDYFGCCVSVFLDQIIIGASGNDLGAAYIYEWDEGELSPMTLEIAMAGESDARISWNAINGATFYDIYRSTIPYFESTGSPWQTIAAPITEVTFSSGVGDPNNNYFFIGIARNASQSSSDSNIVGEYDYGMYSTE